ncbi:MAG: leucine-rich repeat protein [Paramuribaculum sp.]|nr:leucine-rich repeat protein [Paramuribaculum sp.]
MKKYIALILVCLIYSNVLALDGFVEIGINIEVNNMIFSVGTYNGERTAICAGLKDEQEITDLIIPDEIVYEGNKYPVVEIREEAFYNCSGLTSITIPESVTSIGYSAFSRCSGLTSVTIPNSVIEIGSYAFSRCSGMTSITIPESVTSIGNGAFYNCSGLTSITIPSSVTEIGQSAFSDCTGLTSVTIPNSVTKIEGEVFWGCSSLISVIIPNSVTSIGIRAFTRCSSLTSVTIPNSVIEIGSYAFYECSALNELTIEDGNETLSLGSTGSTSGLDVFKNCPIGTLYLGRNLSYGTTSPFWNKNTIKSVTIGDSVTKIGDQAFIGCTKLTALTIGNSVRKIGDSAFYSCTGLTSITIPESVTSIGNNAFYGCTGLTSVTIPNSVTIIGGSSFSGCTGLTSITIPNSVTIIGNAFSGCTGLTSITIPSSVTKIGGSAFKDCTGLTSITIPSSVTEIGDSAFIRCTAIKEVMLEDGDNKLTLGDNGFFLGLFSDCPIITLYLGRNLSYKDSSRGPFKHDNTMKSVTIGNSVTTLGEEIFSRCSGLTSVTIPNSVTQICDNAFQSCSSLKELTIEDGNKTLSLGSTGSKRVYEIFIHSPIETLYLGRNLYYSEQDYGPFNSFNIPKNTTMKFVTIGNLVKRIVKNVFGGCKNITSVTSLAQLPPSVYVTSFDDDVYGKATLYVFKSSEKAYKDDDVWKRFDIQTMEVEVGSITFPITEWTGSEGESFSIIPTISPDNADDKTVTWSSSAPSVAGVDETGNVKAISKGTAVITATTSNGLTASCTVTVVPQTGIIDDIDYEIVIGGGEDGKDVVKVTGGKPDPDGTLRIPDEIRIGGKIYPVTEIGDGAFKDCTDIKSVVIPPSVETIGKEAFSGCTNLEEIIVEDSEKILNSDEDAFKNVPVKNIYLGRATTGKTFAGKDSLTDLTIGDKVPAIGSGDFAGCGSIKNITVLNPVPPTLPDDGFDNAVYKNATLKVPDENVDDYKSEEGWENFFNTIGISDIIPIEIEMELADIELIEGETTTVKAIITPENATLNTVTWSSSDEAIATVSATGLVTAIQPGKATITATTSNGLTASGIVTVVAKTIEATGLKLNIEAAEIVEAQTLQLSATIEPEDVTDKTVIWSSSDASVASVDATGLVTGIKPGTAVITASTSNGLTATCAVTVKAKPAGIDGVEGDDENVVSVDGGNIIAPEGSEVFDLNGRKVKPERLHPGIYIVRVPGSRSIKVSVR